MKEVLTSLIIALLIFSSVIFMIVIKSSELRVNAKEALEQCEMSLARDKHCEIVITAKVVE